MAKAFFIRVDPELYDWIDAARRTTGIPRQEWLMKVITDAAKAALAKASTQ